MDGWRSTPLARRAPRSSTICRNRETSATRFSCSPRSGAVVVRDDENWRQSCREAMTVFVDVPFETIWERIRDLPGRPLITSRTEPEVRALYEVRRPRYEEATYTVDGRQPAGALADEVLKLWSV